MSKRSRKLAKKIIDLTVPGDSGSQDSTEQGSQPGNGAGQTAEKTSGKWLPLDELVEPAGPEEAQSSDESETQAKVLQRGDRKSVV